MRFFRHFGLEICIQIAFERAFPGVMLTRLNPRMSIFLSLRDRLEAHPPA
jgi:hypothetical protein